MKHGWILGLACLLCACGPKPGEQYLGDLRARLAAVDSAAAVFDAAPHEAALPAHAKADSALAVIEARMQDRAVNLEQGQPFTDLDNQRRMLKKQAGRQRRIQQETQRTRTQIGHLIEAIVDEATVDAQGTPMDTAYLRKAVSDELRISSHLMEEMEVALDYLNRGLRNLDAVIFRADSASKALTEPQNSAGS